MATGQNHINYLYDSSQEKPSQIKKISDHREDFSQEGEAMIMQMINRAPEDRAK